MRRLIGILLVVLIMAAVAFPMSATATASTPYSYYGTWLNSSTTGTAGIWRCSCNPVNNYLYAAVRLQYYYNGYYYWTKWAYGGASNVYSMVKSKVVASSAYANYADGFLGAKCGDGSYLTYTDYAPK